MFRRKSRAAEPTSSEETAVEEETTREPVQGPVDSAAADEDAARVDLGALQIPAEMPGMELRLQVDQVTEQVQSVLLAGADGAVELQAFAASRHGDLWSEVVDSIAADVSQRGGTVDRREGRFGVELLTRMPVTMADGQAGFQPRRIAGVNGERWLLRATFLGRAALEPELFDRWDDVLTGVVVHRGSQAMPPGERLPLTMPPGATPVS